MTDLTRRSALFALGGAAAMAATAPGLVQAQATPRQAGAGEGLAGLSRRLAAAPRRRSFTTVPFMIDRPELWDHEAAELVLRYGHGPKQLWEVTDLAAAWPNLMREALNGQVFAHGHRDFLAVAAVHGGAHAVLFDQPMWDKYGLAANTGGSFARNELIVQAAGLSPADDRQRVDGFYGPANNSLPALQQRGAVFVACHDSIHAIARRIAARPGGAASTADTIAADLTNHLVEGVVLVPSVVAWLAEAQGAGFTYAKAS